MRTQPGFDPFQNGWEAFDKDGSAGVEQIEAPLMFYAAQPELANQLADRYSSAGLQPIDLRFGVWPDAAPVQLRKEGEPVGIHLDVFGSRQVRYGEATEVERAAIDLLTWQMEEHVREVIKPEHGVSTHRFGKIPTMHQHVVARETREDGTRNWLERGLIDLPTRRLMRERVRLDIIPGRQAAISARLGALLRRYAA